MAHNHSFWAAAAAAPAPPAAAAPAGFSLRGSSSPKDSPAQAARCCSARCLAMADADMPAHHHHPHRQAFSAGWSCCLVIKRNSMPGCHWSTSVCMYGMQSGAPQSQCLARFKQTPLAEQEPGWVGWLRAVGCGAAGGVAPPPGRCPLGPTTPLSAPASSLVAAALCCGVSCWGWGSSSSR
jgi:hypothetical protein